MRTSKRRKSVYLNVGVFRQDDGSIHLTGVNVQGFHVAVNEDPIRKNGHSTLFKRLDALLGNYKLLPIG